MRRALVGLVVVPLLAGCGANVPPEVTPATATNRASCDGFAARAIQAQDLAVATTLAAQASECYANLQNRR